jgi:hypothetical protein
MIPNFGSESFSLVQALVKVVAFPICLIVWEDVSVLITKLTRWRQPCTVLTKVQLILQHYEDITSMLCHGNINAA